MANDLFAPPALSTSAEHLFEHIEPEVSAAEDEAQTILRTEDELRSIYEIARTAGEIRAGKRRRIALQFPDSMLGDAPWVAEALKSELRALGNADTPKTTAAPGEVAETSEGQDTGSEAAKPVSSAGATSEGKGDQQERIYILADTSYSSCCVDEIAAEHVAADVVVHYGRSCLSPTSRLPVVYVFTRHSLDEDAVLEAFEKTFEDKQSKVVLMADITYHDHVPTLAARIRSQGYTSFFHTAISHNPLGRIPNRLIVDHKETDVSAEINLKEYAVFHIATPPTALLLALSSRVESLHIMPTATAIDSSTPASTVPTSDTTGRLLGRRYAKILSLATAGTIGILVNTLSVADYLPSIDGIRQRIAAAGKKSYSIVVGKLNPAKLANFAEIDGWVVVGCWESSLAEDDAGFYRPVVTPFELDIALAGDDARVWDGSWWGGIEGVSRPGAGDQETAAEKSAQQDAAAAELEGDGLDAGDIDDDESEPPEFDWRTGKLVSRSRPMRMISGNHSQGTSSQSDALALRPKSDLATVNGVVSPGAEFLRSQRTWQGLGTDFDRSELSVAIEEGRSGVARGYTVGENDERR